MARVYTGTAGWSYEDWEGIVYPVRRGAGFHPLTCLARFMDMVEINSTFYRLPFLTMSMWWVKKVAAIPELLFAVKLFQDFTHKREGAGSKEADLFKRGIEPIAAAGRLAALLVQKRVMSEPWLGAVISAKANLTVPFPLEDNLVRPSNPSFTQQPWRKDTPLPLSSWILG